MKGLVLAAGKGTRIDCLTNGSPKSLLPLGSTTVLGHSLQQFERAGVNDLVVVTGYRRSELVDYVQDNWSGRVEFVFNPHYGSTNVLYSFWLALPYLQGSDFFFLHADTVFSSKVLARLQAHRSEASVVFAVDDHPCEDEEMKVRIVDNRVIEVTKQMAWSASDGEFLGLARIAESVIPTLRKHAENLFEAGQFNAFFEQVVQQMIDQEGWEVEVTDVTGLPWREIDFPEDYQVAQEFFG